MSWLWKFVQYLFAPWTAHKRIGKLDEDCVARYERLNREAINQAKIFRTQLSAIPVKEMREAVEQVRRHTSVSADIDMRGESYCIVVGRYKNRDYVRLFPMPERELKSLIEQLHHAEKHYRRGRIDVPHGMERMVEHAMIKERWDP